MTKVLFLTMLLIMFSTTVCGAASLVVPSEVLATIAQLMSILALSIRRIAPPTVFGEDSSLSTCRCPLRRAFFRRWRINARSRVIIEDQPSTLEEKFDVCSRGEQVSAASTLQFSYKSFAVNRVRVAIAIEGVESKKAYLRTPSSRHSHNAEYEI
jgi:hypothetical protein